MSVTTLSMDYNKIVGRSKSPGYCDMISPGHERLTGA